MNERTKERIALVVMIVCIIARNIILPNLNLDEVVDQAVRRVTGGIGGASIALWVLYRSNRREWEKADPQKRREMELKELDERNQLIQEKAAAFSFEAGTYALAAAFMVLTVLDCTPGQIAVAAIFFSQQIAYGWRVHWLRQRM